MATTTTGHGPVGGWATRFRRDRWQMLLQEFPDLAEMTVLDLGGTLDCWVQAPVRPRRVVSLNLAPAPSPPDVEWFENRTGDACDPGSVTETFDLVYSNSVIEHVGGHQRRIRFAEVVEAAAPRHWIQTPNRWFPVEPHWLCPAFQFLPLSARVFLSRYWPLGSFRCGRSTPDRLVVGDVMDIELITERQLRYYFPASAILHERVGALTKSLIAVRQR